MDKIFYLLKIIYLKIKFRKNIDLNGLQKISLDSSILIKENGSITLGRHVCLRGNVHLATVTGQITIGNKVFFNRNCIIVSRDKIDIGDNCSFGPNVVIYDHDHEFDYEGVNANSYKTAPIIIEKGVWVGSGAIILRGTHIGEGAVIGAGSVVKGDIPAHSLVTTDCRLKITGMNRK